MYCKVYSLAVCLCHEMKKPRLAGATIFLVMKTKTKRIFFLAALCFSAMACGGSLTKPVSGLDVTLLPAQLLSISPVAAGDRDAKSKPAGEHLRTTETKTINQTDTVNN